VSVAGDESGGDDARAFGDGTIGLVGCNGSGLQWKWVAMEVGG
jgi:hypothetical protein